MPIYLPDYLENNKWELKKIMGMNLMFMELIEWSVKGILNAQLAI